MGFDPAALVIAGGFLPGYPTFGFNLGDVVIAPRRALCRLWALNGRLGRWNNDLNNLAKACCKKITGGRSIMGTVSDKPGNWTINLIEKIRHGCWITNIIRGQL